MLLQSMFVDRKEEMADLEKRYHGDRPELILLYGRRRVGKTRLIKEFIKDKRGIYLLSDASDRILDVFSEAISKEHPFVRFSNWDDFFGWIDSMSKDERFVLVLDEFQYLYQTDKSFPTVLQRWWETLKATHVMIILCGSTISVIHRIAMGYGSSLYGRKTADLELGRLDPFYASQFFPGIGFGDFVSIYSIVGGIPRYLEEMTGDIETDLREKVFDKNSFLHNEPMNLLFEEFKDHGRYLAILDAIANGSVRFNEISQKSRIPSTSLSKYLNVLERVSLIAKEDPVFGSRRDGIYVVCDELFRFWFRFIYPNRNLLEMGMAEEVVSSIRTSMVDHVARSFEGIARSFIVHKNRRGEFPARYGMIGRWWHKGEEVDLICIDEKGRNALLIEVKWRGLSSEQIEEIVSDLKRKAKMMPLAGYKIRYGIVCKRSLSKKGENVFDLEDLERIRIGLK